MEKERIIKNYFTLSLYDVDAEEEFKAYVNHRVLSVNKWISLINSFISVGNIILSQIINSSLKKNLKWIESLQIFAYVILGILTTTTVVTFLSNNELIQRVSKIINFIFLGIFFYYLRTILSALGLIDEQLYSLIRLTEFTYRIIWILLLLLTFPDAYIMCFSVIVMNVALICVLFSPYKTINSIISMCLILFIAYFYNKQVKNNFMLNWVQKKQNLWYEDLLEHLNSSFINIRNSQVNYLNTSLFEILLKNKKFVDFLEESYCKSTESSKIDHYINIDRQNKIKLLQSHSESVIEILISHINNEFDEEVNNIKNFKTLKEFIENKHNHLTVTSSKNKFKFLGFKSFDGTDNANVNFEVYYRYKNLNQIEEIELMFYDISRIREYEKTNAELKFKTQFLAKIAHEFNNPLISISELVNQVKESVLFEFSNVKLDEKKLGPHGNSSGDSGDEEIIKFKNPKNKVKNFNNEKVFTLLDNIKSFSNFLQIQIKNFEYFSQSQLKSLPTLDLKITDLKEVIDFCKRIGDTLIIKYSKNVEVFIKYDKNINFPFEIKTDSLKLKQVLVNLISNAIKFTDAGMVELSVIYDKEESVCKFTVTDTGQGMSERSIKDLFILKPFDRAMTVDNKLSSGLGIFVVIEILKQFNSTLEVESVVGEGTSFSFSLPVNVICTGNSFFNFQQIQIPHLPFESENVSMKTVTIENLEVALPDKIHFGRKISLFADKNNDQSEHEEIIAYDKSISYFIVIDDEKLIRKSTIRNLSKIAAQLERKIEIIEGEDGIECLYLVFKYIKIGFKISAILSDELMIYMNGSKAAEILKSLTKFNFIIPFVLLTSFSSSDSQFIDYHITKPLNDKDSEFILNLN